MCDRAIVLSRIHNKQSPIWDLLENYSIPQLVDDCDIIFNLDEAPSHFGIIVRQSLDNNFLERWLGRGEPIPWAPYSPVLFGFFYMGICEKLSKSTKPH